MTPPLCALDQRVVYSQRSQVTPSLKYQFEQPDLPLNSVKENILLTLTLNKNPATVLVLYFFFHQFDLLQGLILTKHVIKKWFFSEIISCAFSSSNWQYDCLETCISMNSSICNSHQRRMNCIFQLKTFHSGRVQYVHCAIHSFIIQLHQEEYK